MIKIEYPKNIDKFKSDYLDLFPKSSLLKKQELWQSTNSYLAIGSVSFSDILVADFKALANYTKILYDLNFFNEESLLKSIFKYETYQSRIAKFFMKYKDVMNVQTCFYCNSAYIFTYETSLGKKNQFDLDHFIPKSMFPIVGLSLFNLVPSCQICNEKLKKEQLLLDLNNLVGNESPSSDNYSFGKSVKMKVVPIGNLTNDFIANKDNYEIDISTMNNDYKKAIDVFKLKDRYNFHKSEALRLLDLQSRYPESYINEIASLLGRLPIDVREDIFGEHFVEDNSRIFSKLRKDIMENY